MHSHLFTFKTRFLFTVGAEVGGTSSVFIQWSPTRTPANHLFETTLTEIDSKSNLIIQFERCKSSTKMNRLDTKLLANIIGHLRLVDRIKMRLVAKKFKKVVDSIYLPKDLVLATDNDFFNR